MNTKKLPEKSTEIDLGELTLPELIELMHKALDEVLLRCMECS